MRSGGATCTPQFRRDVDERPWAKTEVGNYLRREAQLYRDHPDFRDWWS